MNCRKIIIKFIMICVFVTGTFVLSSQYDVHAENSGIDLKEVFEQWVNYPGANLGAGYKAGWSYNANTGALNTTANVGFTGYYNPNLMSFTTGTFGCDFQSSDTDPWGFAWGIKKWKNASNQDVYSFYMYEVCGHNHWCIAYIDEWVPAKDAGSHRGPVYHSTIDAADSQYAAHNEGKGSVGFSTGKVLAYGEANVKGIQHRVTIKVNKKTVTVASNGTKLAEVEAPVQAGSFGPCSASNAGAYFYNLTMEAAEDNGAVRADFQTFDNGVASNAGKVGDTLSLEDRSWPDPSTKATIKSEEWTVYYGDELIYQGSTPYEGVVDREGEYKIVLNILTSQGLTASKTKYFTVTDENIVTVKYIDGFGNKLCDDIVYRGKVGDPYTTSALSFKGYVLDEIDGNQVGKFSDKPIGVTYVYKKSDGGVNEDDGAAPVIAKYVDEEGNELLPSITYKGTLGYKYTTKQLDIPGYTFLKMADDSDEVNGRFGYQDKNVVYVYTRDTTSEEKKASIVVRYVDTNGKTMLDDRILTGTVGEKYQIEKPAIPGYVVKSVEGAEKGTFAEGEIQMIKVVYTPEEYTACSAVARYVDTEGNTFETDRIINGNAGDKYTTEELEFEGYGLKEIQGSAPSGTLVADKVQFVTCVYHKLGNVAVHFVDEEGHSILDDKVISGAVDSSYDVPDTDIYGYQYVETQGDRTGTFIDGNIEVTMVYKVTNPSTVAARYVDENGNLLCEDIIYKGEVGSQYKTVKLAIKGYEFVKVEGQETRKITENPKIVTYIYKLKDTTPVEPEVTGKVTAKYVDEDGNSIYDSLEYTGKVGENYKVSQITIPGYELKETVGNPEGLYEETDQEVKYVYSKKDPDQMTDEEKKQGGSIVVRYEDKDGNIIKEEVINGQVGDEFEIEKPNLPGYEIDKVIGEEKGQIGENIKVIKVVYNSLKDKEGTESSVIAKYVDENGNIIHFDNLYTGQVGSQYTTKSETIKGYKLVKIEGEPKGEYTEDIKTVTYVYKTVCRVIVKYVDENGKVIKTQKVYVGDLGDSYRIKHPNIAGYKYVRADGNEKGYYVKGDQVLTYVYKRSKVSYSYSKDKKTGNKSNLGDEISQSRLSDNVQTSDESQTYLYMVMALVSMIGALYITKKSKKAN